VPGDATPADDPVPIAIAVVQDGSVFLVGQRPPGAALAGCWEFPGGKVLPGETCAEAAVRECREETGLQVSVREPLLTRRHRYAHGYLELHFFLCEVELPGRTPAPPFRWVPREDLSRYPFPEGNRPLLCLLTQPGISRQ
jgi:mutator protein MutT